MAKRPWEVGFFRSMQEQGYYPESREAGMADQVGVQGLIGVLGGLRYMVATFLELRAFAYWEPPPEWDPLAETYRMINLLQPRSEASWETAAWH
ncbi:MAG: hypothetical protein AAF191_04645, partial [Verrucomicrobiota bacterium]